MIEYTTLSFDSILPVSVSIEMEGRNQELIYRFVYVRA